jgi:DNA-binding transcriptional LysR family regulator
VDTLTNLKAFLAVARTGSFAAAARELKVAPSVVTKRICQIEWQLKTPLFERNTRKVSLTATGLRYLPAVQRSVSDMDELFAEIPSQGQALQGTIRIKSPGTLAVQLLGPILERFQQRYPLVNLELLTLDRSVNPVDEGFDVALTLMPDTYAGVIEVPLSPMPRVLCASPAYLERKGIPAHPRELVEHDILNFLPTGTIWIFEGAMGEVQVRLQPRFNTNEGQLILSGALAGNGIARLSDYLYQRHLKSGALVPLLADYPIKQLWFKALVPENRIQVARVQALLGWVKSNVAEPQQSLDE